MEVYELIKVIATLWFHWWIINGEALVKPSKIVEHLLATKEMFSIKFWLFIRNSRLLKALLMLQISLGGRCGSISTKIVVFAWIFKNNNNK